MDMSSPEKPQGGRFTQRARRFFGKYIPGRSSHPNSEVVQSLQENPFREKSLDIARRTREIFTNYVPTLEQVNYARLAFGNGEKEIVSLIVQGSPRMPLMKNGQISPMLPIGQSERVNYMLNIHDPGPEENIGYSPRERLSTEWGILPQLVIASNGNLYRVYSGYSYNEDGRADNISFISCETDAYKGKTPEEILREIYHLEERDISMILASRNNPDIEYTGGELGNFHHIPLNEYDYERIETTLKAIEDKEFVLIKPPPRIGEPDK